MRLRRWFYASLVGLGLLTLVVLAGYVAPRVTVFGVAGDGPVEINSIIGTDERYRILDTTTEPYPKVVLLESTFPSGIQTCTGWFIGTDSVVTAGHCVHLDSYGGWAEEVLVAPAANIDSGDGSVIFPYGTQTTTTYYAPDGWTISELAEHDYAVIRLPDTTLGDQTGYFSYGYYSDAYFDTIFDASIAGYPVDQPYPTMWLSFDDHGGVDGGILSYLTDTYSGQSGAPVWKYAIERTVIGIHTRSVSSSSCAEGMNCGVRITPEVADNLLLWGGAESPQTDCLPLYSRVIPPSGGSVSRLPELSPGCRESEYAEDSPEVSSVVTLTAVPEPGYVFLGWQGTNSEFANPTMVTMTQELTVTATFTEAIPGPVTLDTLNLDDDISGNSHGNDDGIPNCGERLELDLTLRNAGYGAAEAITATVTSTHALVDIVDGEATIGDITALSVITSPAALMIDILPDYEGSEQAVLAFIFTDSEGSTWQDSATLDIFCPVQNEMPYSPFDPSPADGAQNVAIDLILTWSGGDPDGDLVTYDIYSDTNDISPANLVCNDVTVLECDLGTLEFSTSYTWQVIARDALGAVTVGDIWDFTTVRANEAPYAPSSPSPTDGAIDQPRELILTWVGGDPDGEAVTYDVFFDDGAAMPVTLVCDDVPEAMCPVPELAYGTQYAWYVVARDTFNETTTGDLWLFITDDTRTLFLPYVVRE